MNEGHVSVLLKETLDSLEIRPEGSYLDVTGGGGGHSAAILERLSDKGKLKICDYHAETVENLRRRFAGDPRVTVLLSPFSRVFENADERFDGIIADFGVSSLQLADARAGIAFSHDEAPLDMRLSVAARVTAMELIQNLSETELADLFFRFGGERHSRRIAAAIVMDRDKGIFYNTAGGLRGLCERVLGRFYRGKKIHPATKVFQALRIAVNDELGEVASFLREAPLKLKSGGVLAVISFHEGEDRLAKTGFREREFEGGFELKPRKSIKPSKEEIASNPRARSARLRVMQKL